MRILPLLAVSRPDDGGAARVASWLTSVVLACAPMALVAQPAPAPAAPATTSAAPSAATASATPALSDIVIAAARAEAMRREIQAALDATEDMRPLVAELSGIESRVEDTLERVKAGEFSRLRYDTLLDIDSRIRERERSATAATTALRTALVRLERDIDRLDREIAAWPNRVRAASEQAAPEEILARARQIGPDLVAEREAVRKRRDEVLLAFDRGTRLLAHFDTLRAAVAARRDAIGRQLRSAEEAAVWETTETREDHGIVAAEFANARQMLADYLRSEGSKLLLGIAAIAAFFAAFVRRAPGRRDANGTTGERVSWPSAIAAGVLVAMVTLAFAAPTGPTAFYPLWWFPVPLLAAWVADRQFDVAPRATLWALAAAGSLNTFNLLAEMQPGAERVLLALQTLPLGFALVHDWRRRSLDRQLSRLHPITVRALTWLMLAALAAALAASLSGFVGLARTLRGVAITATGAMIVFAVTAAVIKRVIGTLLATAIGQRLRGVREEGEAVRRFFGWIVDLAAVIGWVLLLVYTQNLVDAARQWVTAFGSARIRVRDFDLSASAVVLAVLIALGTAALIRVVRFLLTVEILPRFRLRQGVPFAVATLASYSVAVIGFVLALAALGVDLTKVTLLAGALGVGIGFGLQNIVNNFVSGLILVLERPVNVGDQIAVGDLVGDVRRIGIRSATVRTFQGAEVIVPNSDLVSKQVVNWTLSDRSRRYEIDVGVAYGSDVDLVMKLLVEAAAAVPEVLRDPPPRVLFAGFGESSLDFRLLAWAQSVDVGLQAQTNLRREILGRLERAGIEIPFPQRDVHVRTSAPAQ